MSWIIILLAFFYSLASKFKSSDFFASIFLNFTWKTEEQNLKLAKSGTFSVILTHSGVQFTMDKKGQTPFKFLEFFLTFKGHFSPSILHLGITWSNSSSNFGHLIWPRIRLRFFKKCGQPKNANWNASALSSSTSFDLYFFGHF